MMGVYTQVRNAVPAIEAARRYGLVIDRHGRACCCFHDDANPSLSFKNRRFRCWSCGAHGDSIDLTARLLGLDAKGALRRLSADFALGLPLDKPPTASERRQAAEMEHRRDVSRRFDEWRTTALNGLCMAIRVGNMALNGIETPRDLSRLTPEQVQSVRLLPWLEDTEERLSHGTEAEQLEIFAVREEVKRICNYLNRAQKSLKTG